MGSFLTKATDTLPSIESSALVKNKIREWAPKNCPCRLCKMYVQSTGFL